MPTPTLTQPATVVIEPLDRGNTKYNTRTRAPIKVLKRKTQVSFEAQVQFHATERAEAGSGGLVKTTTGYMIARKTDLDGLGYVPSMGDRLVTIGPLTGQVLYITEFAYTAWYDGAPTLLSIEFDDRRPSRGGE